MTTRTRRTQQQGISLLPGAFRWVWLALATTAAGALPAAAAPVTITPTTIVLGADHMTALVTITNESDGPTRFETGMNVWRQDF